MFFNTSNRNQKARQRELQSVKKEREQQKKQMKEGMKLRKELAIMPISSVRR